VLAFSADGNGDVGRANHYILYDITFFEEAGMAKLEIRANRYTKVTGDSNEAAPTGTKLRAIIEVIKNNYVPEGVALRERIDPKIFTAEFSPAELQTLNSDPSVKSIALSEKVQIID